MWYHDSSQKYQAQGTMTLHKNINHGEITLLWWFTLEKSLGNSTLCKIPLLFLLFNIYLDSIAWKLVYFLKLSQDAAEILTPSGVFTPWTFILFLNWTFFYLWYFLRWFKGKSLKFTSNTKGFMKLLSSK